NPLQPPHPGGRARRCAHVRDSRSVGAAAGAPSRRRVLLSDTVGFIRNLPTTLVKAFRATLEEVTEAALVLHVADISSPAASEQTTHVLQVLSEIGAGEIPRILVLNKMDRVDAAHGNFDKVRNSSCTTAISALTGEGMDGLLRAIDAILPLDPVVRASFRFTAKEAGEKVALLHEFGRVLETRYTGDQCEIEAEVPESLQRRLSSSLIASGTRG